MNKNIFANHKILIGVFSAISVCVIIFTSVQIYNKFIFNQQAETIRLQQEKELHQLLLEQKNQLEESKKQIAELKEIDKKNDETTNNKILNLEKNIQTNKKETQIINYDNIPLKAVVRVVCVDNILNLKNTETVFGSGLLYDRGGSIITNAHVTNYNYESTCFAAIQNDFRQAELAKYTADVEMIWPKLDVAVLQIQNEYIDNEVKTAGIVKATNKNGVIACKYEDVKIGDKLIVVGYPTLGGFSMTITEGIVSGFQNDYIKTSAKIEHGNSGGAAFHYSGCWLGIPSASNVGEIESLGLILRADKL